MLADGLLELHGLEREPEFLVAVLLKRVEVIADVTREQDGILGYARDPAPEVFQAERARVGAIEPHPPAAGLHQSPERDDEGALAAAGATADANLLASFDVKRDPFQHKRKAGSVPHLQSLERYSARGGQPDGGFFGPPLTIAPVDSSVSSSVNSEILSTLTMLDSSSDMTRMSQEAARSCR